MKNVDNSLLQNMTQDEIAQIIERIIYLRTDILQVTQSQFAKSVDLSQTYFSLLENRKKDLTMSVIMQIADNLNVKLSWLLYGDDHGSIFAEEPECIQPSDSITKSSLLLELRISYNLTDKEYEFLKAFLSLKPSERLQITDAINILSSLK